MPFDDLDSTRLVARNLALDAAALEVIRALETARISAILLKGASTAHWLYGKDELRPQADIDILVSQRSFPSCGPILETLGFEAIFDVCSYYQVWRRDCDQISIDLHFTLPIIRVPADEAWEVLSSQVDSLTLYDELVPTLSVPARTLHLAIHALQNPGPDNRARQDLARATRQVPRQDWAAAVALARRLGDEQIVAAALRLCTDNGDQLADELGLSAKIPWHLATRVDERAAFSNILLGLHLRPTWKLKTQYLREKLWPSEQYLGQVAWDKLFHPDIKPSALKLPMRMRYFLLLALWVGTAAQSTLRTLLHWPGR